MILFFGTKTGKKEEVPLRGVGCKHCHQSPCLRWVSQPNYFHLFWIPLFKIQTFCKVVCTHCKKVYDENEFTPEIKKAVSY